MFRFDPGLKVFLHRDAVDGRKHINGLAALVEQALGRDPLAPAVFAFSNRRRDRVRLLLWERHHYITWSPAALRCHADKEIPAA